MSLLKLQLLLLCCLDGMKWLPVSAPLPGSARSARPGQLLAAVSLFGSKLKVRCPPAWPLQPPHPLLPVLVLVGLVSRSMRWISRCPIALLLQSPLATFAAPCRYEETKKEAEKWVPIIKANREAPTIRFTADKSGALLCC